MTILSRLVKSTVVIAAVLTITSGASNAGYHVGGRGGGGSDPKNLGEAFTRGWAQGCDQATAGGSVAQMLDCNNQNPLKPTTTPQRPPRLPTPVHRGASIRVLHSFAASPSAHMRSPLGHTRRR
jgi:hypothetical protein